MKVMKPQYLECDQCGYPLRELSNSESRKVAINPYNFIVYCNQCKKDVEKELEIGN